MDTGRILIAPKPPGTRISIILFIEPGATALPEKCCTLAISPLIKELVTA
jgi:hypothetical protein